MGASVHGYECIIELAGEDNVFCSPTDIVLAHVFFSSFTIWAGMMLILSFGGHNTTTFLH